MAASVPWDAQLEEQVSAVTMSVTMELVAAAAVERGGRRRWRRTEEDGLEDGAGTARGRRSRRSAPPFGSKRLWAHIFQCLA